MLAKIENNERNYDIRDYGARHRCVNSIGDCGHLKSTAIKGGAYVSSSDWALHRSRGLGRWSIYSAALRLKFFTPWHRSVGGTDGELGRVGARNGVKNMARVEMKQFLIEQIPVLFFIGAFFLMMALGG